MDRQIDRRAFLHRMTAITAAVSAGSAVYAPRTLLGAASAAAVASPAERSRVHRMQTAASPFRWPVRLPHPGSITFDTPADLTIAEAAALIQSRDLSPVDLVRACIERIDALEPVYQAFNTVLRERALADARRLEHETWKGPLHGIPLAVKDNYYTEGVPTTANSHIFENFVPEFDATAVKRLRAAGGILLGKTQMGPLATSRATTPDGKNTTLNAWAPHDGEISPGGSSSGSATAVAARLATSSIGTQTGGSITGPSSQQGLTGLKPTMGRVSLYGVIPLTYTRDHPGPLARDARDAAIMLQAMAGPDPADPRTQRQPPVTDYVAAADPVRRGGRTALRWPTTIGFFPDFLDPPEPPSGRGDEQISEEERIRREQRRTATVNARRRMLAVYEELGARVVEVPEPPHWDPLAGREFNNVRLPERSEPFLEYLQDDVRWFGVSLSAWINGLLLPGTEYLRGQRARLFFLRHVLEHVYEHCDVVVQVEARQWDSIGLPLIAFPIGFEESSTGSPLPIAGMLGGLPHSEDRLLSLAAAYQDVTDWHRRRPADPSSFPIAVRPGSIHRGRPMDTRWIAEYGE